MSLIILEIMYVLEVDPHQEQMTHSKGKCNLVQPKIFGAIGLGIMLSAGVFFFGYQPNSGVEKRNEKPMAAEPNKNQCKNSRLVKLGY